MSQRRLQYPDWIYKPLPYIYMLMGVLIALPLPSVITVGSGVLFFAAGVMVWVNRYRYRKAFNSSGGHIEVLRWSDDDAPVEGGLQISWRSSFECGQPLIDAQHRRLFGMGNRFVSAVLAQKPKDELLALLEEFVTHMNEHFRAEEEVFSRTKQALTSEHRKDHRFLATKAQDMLERFRKDEVSARDLVGFVVYEVVVDHILKEDLRTDTRKANAAKKRSSAKGRGGPAIGEPLRFSAERQQSKKQHDKNTEGDSVWHQTGLR